MQKNHTKIWKYQKILLYLKCEIKLIIDMNNTKIKSASSEQHVTANTTTKFIESLTNLKVNIYKDIVGIINDGSSKKLNQDPIYSFEEDIIYLTYNKENGYYRDFEKLDAYIINLITECKNNYQAAVELWLSLMVFSFSFHFIMDKKPQLKQDYEFFTNWWESKYDEFDTAMTLNDSVNILLAIGKLNEM